MYDYRIYSLIKNNKYSGCDHASAASHHRWVYGVYSSRRVGKMKIRRTRTWILQQYPSSVGSLCVNGLILTLITRQQGKAVGTYKYLLSCFAINDIVYTILHYVSFPVSHCFLFMLSYCWTICRSRKRFLTSSSYEVMDQRSPSSGYQCTWAITPQDFLCSSPIFSIDW